MFWFILGAGAASTFLVLMWFIGRNATSPEQARARFVEARPALEGAFFLAASASGKPRGLRWLACDWGEGALLVRERGTGRLAALVSVTIRFEAIPGSDMEGLPAVGNLRSASAVFFYHRGVWHTTGKALFNLSPDEAVERFSAHYERLPERMKAEG
jgi:hypothetical protein